MLFLFISLIVTGLAANDDEIPDPHTLVDDCGNGVTFSRAECIACILDAVDVDHNGQVTPAEIQGAKDNYLHWWENGLLYVDGGATVERILQDCDPDNKGYITLEDMRVTWKTCLALNDANDRPTGLLCKVKHYLCDRATAALGHHVYKK